MTSALVGVKKKCPKPNHLKLLFLAIKNYPMQHREIIKSVIRYFLILSLSVCHLTSLLAQPQQAEWDTSSPYYQIMVKNVNQLEDSLTAPLLNQLAASFERIARVEKDKALPQYYLAFIYANMSFLEQDIDKMDTWCDRSELSLAKAEQIGGIAKEEIFVIRALIQYGRIMVDYMARGMEASAQAERYLREGYKLNPKNPRILAMLCQHYLRIPPQAGGSREKSCQFAAQAVGAFVEENESFPKEISPIVPHWGLMDLLEVAQNYCDLQPTGAKAKTR